MTELDISAAIYKVYETDLTEKSFAELLSVLLINEKFDLAIQALQLRALDHIAHYVEKIYDEAEG